MAVALPARGPVSCFGRGWEHVHQAGSRAVWHSARADLGRSERHWGRAADHWLHRRLYRRRVHGTGLFVGLVARAPGGLLTGLPAPGPNAMHSYTIFGHHF